MVIILIGISCPQAPAVCRAKCGGTDLAMRKAFQLLREHHQLTFLKCNVLEHSMCRVNICGSKFIKFMVKSTGSGVTWTSFQILALCHVLAL